MVVGGGVMQIFIDSLVVDLIKNDEQKNSNYISLKSYREERARERERKPERKKRNLQSIGQSEFEVVKALCVFVR